MSFNGTTYSDTGNYTELYSGNIVDGSRCSLCISLKFKLWSRNFSFWHSRIPGPLNLAVLSLYTHTPTTNLGPSPYRDLCNFVRGRSVRYGGSTIVGKDRTPIFYGVVSYCRWSIRTF